MIEWFIYGLCNLPAFAVFAWIITKHEIPEHFTREQALAFCTVLFVLGPIGSALAAVGILAATVDIVKAPNNLVGLKEWLRKDFL